MKNKYFNIELTEGQLNQLLVVLFHDGVFENHNDALALYFAIDNQITAQTITEEED